MSVPRRKKSGHVLEQRGKNLQDAPTIEDTLDVWHVRLGYLGEQNAKRLVNMSLGMDLTKPLQKASCQECSILQGRSKPHSSHISPCAYPNDLVHSDLDSPVPLSAGGAKYFVTFLDNYTDGSNAHFLKPKDKTFPAFKTFKVQTERGPYIIRRLRTDYEGEYGDHDFRDFRLDQSGSQLCPVPLNKTEPRNAWVKLLYERLAPCCKVLVYVINTGTRWFAQPIKYL